MNTAIVRSIALVTSLTLATATAHAAPTLPKGIDTDCIGTMLLQCEVTSAGFVSVAGGIGIAYQLQSGHSDQYGIGAGVVLYAQKDGEWVLLDTDFAGVAYQPPRLIEGDLPVVHVPGFMQGTGSHNADLLFIGDYENGEWQRIDIDSWRDGIADLLPEGLEIWKGVDYDFGDWFYSTFNARTPLWNDSDANCCPTGGWAEIEFEITDGRLVPVKVHYRPEE